MEKPSFMELAKQLIKCPKCGLEQSNKNIVCQNLKCDEVLIIAKDEIAEFNKRRDRK